MKDVHKIILAITTIAAILITGITVVSNIDPPEKIHISLQEGNADTIMVYVNTGFFVGFLTTLPNSYDRDYITVMGKEITYINGTEIKTQSEYYTITRESLSLNNNSAVINLLEHTILVELKQ